MRTLMRVDPPAHHPAGVLDPDDISGCPIRPGCESCGAVDDIGVATGDTPLGVSCLTLCTSCADAGDMPRWPVATAMHRVIEHCQHLDTDLDTLVAAARHSRGL